MKAFLSFVLFCLFLPLSASAERTDVVRIGPAGTQVFVAIRKCIRPTGEWYAPTGETQRVYEYDRCSSLFATGAELTDYLQSIGDDVPADAVLSNGDPVPKPWDVERRASKAFRLNIVTGATSERVITYTPVDNPNTDHTYDVQ